MESLFGGIWCIKHGRIDAEKPRKGKEAFSYGNTTSPLKILKLKPTDKEQQLDYKKVDVGFVAQQMLKKSLRNLCERQVLQFKMESKDFLAKTASKLHDKTPINIDL